MRTKAFKQEFLLMGLGLMVQQVRAGHYGLCVCVRSADYYWAAGRAAWGGTMGLRRKGPGRALLRS